MCWALYETKSEKKKKKKRTRNEKKGLGALKKYWNLSLISAKTNCRTKVQICSSHYFNQRLVVVLDVTMSQLTLNIETMSLSWCFYGKESGQLCEPELREMTSISSFQLKTNNYTVVAELIKNWPWIWKCSDLKLLNCFLLKCSKVFLMTSVLKFLCTFEFLTNIQIFSNIVSHLNCWWLNLERVTPIQELEEL